MSKEKSTDHLKTGWKQFPWKNNLICVDHKVMREVDNWR